MYPPVPIPDAHLKTPLRWPRLPAPPPFCTVIQARRQLRSVLAYYRGGKMRKSTKKGESLWLTNSHQTGNLPQVPQVRDDLALCGSPVVVETGKMCGLSNGSAMIRYGGCLRAVQHHDERQTPRRRRLLPLSDQFGKNSPRRHYIGGFMRRERPPPVTRHPLSSRVVDRPIVTVPEGTCRNDVCVTMTVMSLDPDCSAKSRHERRLSPALAISSIQTGAAIAGDLRRRSSSNRRGSASTLTFSPDPCRQRGKIVMLRPALTGLTSGEPRSARHPCRS